MPGILPKMLPTTGRCDGPSVDRLRNLGKGPAQSVFITDTMVGLRYLVDTSLYPVITDSLPQGGEIAGFNVGTLAPGSDVQFDLYVDVEAALGQQVSNEVLVARVPRPRWTARSARVGENRCWPR